MATSRYEADPSAATPGGKRPRGVKVTFVGLMVMCGLLLIITGVLSVQNAVEIAAVGQAKFFGTETQGTVVDKTRAPQEGRQIEYTYQTVDGRSFTKRVSVGASLWNSLETGSPVAVRYATDTPTVAILARGDRIFWWSVLRMVTKVLFLVLLGYGIVKARHFSKDMDAYY